jgi:protein O-GlcNAc transferase
MTTPSTDSPEIFALPDNAPALLAPRRPPDLRIAMGHHKAGRLDDAESAYRQRLSVSPDDPAALHGLGMLCQQTGQPAEAIDRLRRAVELAPRWAVCRSSLAAALGMQGRHAEAADLLQDAVRLEPRNPVIWNNLGVALEKTGRPADAVNAYRRAVELAPGYAEAFDHLGNALRGAGRPAEAETAHRQAIGLKPDYAPAYNNLAATLAQLGRGDEVVECFRTMVALRPMDPAAGSDLLVALHYTEATGPRQLFEEHVTWADRHARPIYSRPVDSRATPRELPALDGHAGRPLRLGYVSPDFREYPAARFFEPLLAGHDRQNVTVFCYSDVATPDAVTARLRACGDSWRDISGMTDERVEGLIRQDRIDILVDLAGHMANPRLQLFARKPAPVQVSYIGYPDTTGLPTIDYRITDEWHDPIDPAQGQPRGMTDALHTERLVRLPRCCWAYEPGEDLPAVNRLPAQTTGRVTFGVMNRLVKVTPRMIGLWSRILSAVPDSRLLVLVAPGCELEPTVRERFVEAGIDSQRLVLVPQRPRRAYLELFNQVDVALDPFPYAGMTTTCDALWMGVPTITLAGNTHVSRTGVSLLSAVGLPELIARSPDEYVDIAVRLESDLNRLALLRSGLRDRVTQSSLFDGAGLARAVEAAFREMWRKWCGGERR